MKQITILDRILLLATGLLAAYQVVKGIDQLETLAIICYTVAFGVLLVAALLLVILGLEVLDNKLVVIVSTIIPLSMSAGLVVQYLSEFGTIYLIFAIFGFMVVVATRIVEAGRLAVLVLAFVHGVAGLIIFLLPIILSLRGEAPLGFALVGMGGALIGLGGLLLSFLKTGRPILSRDTILTVLPALFFLMTAAFVVGFATA